MRKSHGPALSKQLIDLIQCPMCRGKAVIRGVFHEMACGQCSASGWLAAGTAESLPLGELVTQLSLRLQAADRVINELKHARATGPDAQYQESNRLGAGGNNYTGD
ncbi:hypothetical protein PS623_00391 [Pseudomonas fluorescens]|uniref:hypothetical protein n=1 Tax=Pseudomonas fluorescens TaxID=294 RepID=UPI001241C559|nr:hypothetical protein [Pseudomonas fluorescens]VVM43785.1 hypothetical protein PS623_00391 [Pseudomonas fluorescens]